MGAKNQLCAQRPAATSGLQPTLTLMREATDCGPVAVACGKPGGEVQLTTSAASFAIATREGRMTVGTRANQVSSALVILHEVGHWFGLRHPEEVGVKVDDIMAGVFRSDRTCVSPESLMMLSNAADRRWPFRASANQALLLDPSP